MEGNLRGVVATLTPEQLNENRLQFSQRIASDVRRDLIKLGLQLDILKIQTISDNVDYLNSLGRKQIALVIKDAEIAESNALTEAEQIEAQCEEETAVAIALDRIVIQDKKNESFVEQLRQTTGVDVSKIVNNLTSNDDEAEG